MGIFIINFLYLILSALFGFLSAEKWEFSIYVMSHALVKNKKILKLIPFKIKYFGCISVFQVICYMLSLIFALLELVFLILYVFNIAAAVLRIVGIVLVCVEFLIFAGFIIFNSIMLKKEEKYFQKHFKISYNSYKFQILNCYNNEIKNVKDENLKEKCFQKHLLFFKNYKSVKETKGVYGEDFYYIFELNYKNEEYKIII